MIEMLQVGGVVILIAQELQCRNLTKKLQIQQQINDDLLKKNQFFAQQIQLLQNNSNKSTAKMGINIIQKPSSQMPLFDYALDHYEAKRNKDKSKKFNV